MNSLLIDLDGVIYEGDRVVPGAPEAIAWLVGQHIPHLFVTNTTSRPRQRIVDKLGALGIRTRKEQIFTPPVAASGWLRERDAGRVALFVPEATRTEFDGFESTDTDVEAVVVGDLGNGWTFDSLNRAFRLLMQKPQPALVALGMTRYWQAADGLRLDTAPFVMALAHASGAEPYVLGKPAQAFFDSALSRLDVVAAASWMIGDDVRADVGGAQAAGLRGILVKTGKFRSADLSDEINPDAVLDSIADLPAWWRANRLA